MNIEEVAGQIVDSAIRVHAALGPGLLESAYQKCLIHELQRRRVRAEAEVYLPVEYDGMRIDAGYRIDMRVDGKIIVENKAVDQVLPIHIAQLLTYLKLSGCPIGFLLNWKVRRMKEGIQRLVWNYY